MAEPKSGSVWTGPEKTSQTSGGTNPPKDFSIDEFFKPANILPSVKGLKVATWSEAGAGKTYFAESVVEISKDPVYVVDTEFGAAKVAKYNFPDAFKSGQIKIFEVKVINLETGEADFAKSVEQVEQALTALKNVTKGTIVLDSISDIYTWLNMWVFRTAEWKVSKSGEEYIERKAWQERNEKYYTMIMRILQSPCNVVVTAKEVGVYDEHGKETKAKQARWMDQTPYWLDCLVRIIKAQSVDSNIPDKFTGIVEKFRQKRLQSRIPDITFKKLIDEVYKQTQITIEV